jgi:hypothetical protein
MVLSFRRAIAGGLVTGLLFACSPLEETSTGSNGGSTHESTSGASSTSSGGAVGVGGNLANAGGSLGKGGISGASGGTSAGSGGTATAGKSCNPAQVICKMVAPSCSSMEAAELDAAGTCYTGQCIPIGECSCNVPADCPNSQLFTCRNDIKRCSPFL